MSCSSAVMRFTRTPAGRSTLKSVTVGPATQPTTWAKMLKLSSVSCRQAAVSCSSESVALVLGRGHVRGQHGQGRHHVVSPLLARGVHGVGLLATRTRGRLLLLRTLAGMLAAEFARQRRRPPLPKAAGARRRPWAPPSRLLRPLRRPPEARRRAEGVCAPPCVAAPSWRPRRQAGGQASPGQRPRLRWPGPGLGARGRRAARQSTSPPSRSARFSRTRSMSLESENPTTASPARMTPA